MLTKLTVIFKCFIFVKRKRNNNLRILWINFISLISCVEVGQVDGQRRPLPHQ